MCRAMCVKLPVLPRVDLLLSTQTVLCASHHIAAAVLQPLCTASLICHLTLALQCFACLVAAQGVVEVAGRDHWRADSS
jgi:hypothetical protein